MTYQLSEVQRRDYADDGIVKLPGMIDAALLDELNACFEWSVAHPGPLAVGKPVGDQVMFIDNGNPEARAMYHDLAVRYGLGQVAADLWGGSEFVAFFAEEIFLKRGAVPTTFWHQDTVYLPWGGEHWVNFWIPLVPMTAEQSIRVVRASHKGVMYDGTTFSPKDPTDPLWGDVGNFPRLPDISAEYAADPDSWDLRGFDVQPGDVVALHPHCLHSGGTSGNALSERRNLVLRFHGDKSFYSEHLPDAPGMYERKPIPKADGGFLTDGDPYRPASSVNLMA